MTEQERQKIKAELTEFGFWGVSEPGDPTTDIHAADNYPEAISLAALALPEFLRRCPECAANQR